jgi:hypothetical protein
VTYDQALVYTQRFKAKLTEGRTNTLQTADITQIYDSRDIRRMAIIDPIRIESKDALFADIRTAGQQDTLKRNAIRPRRDTGRKLIGNWTGDMSNM